MNTWLKLGRVEHKNLLSKPHRERKEENQNKDFSLLYIERGKLFPLPSDTLTTEEDLHITVAFCILFLKYYVDVL